MAENQEAAASSSDLRHQYIQKIIRINYPFKNEKQFTKLFQSEGYREYVDAFIGSDSCVTVYIFIQSGRMAMSDEPPQGISKKILYITKKARQPIEEDEDIEELTFYGNLLPDSLETLSLVSREVFLPLLKNPKNVKNLTDVMYKELIQQFDVFLSSMYVTRGHTVGKTFLPIPSFEVEEDEKEKRNRKHVYETAVITWTNQIKDVLKADPENMFKEGNPGPIEEIDFWQSKSQNLNLVHEQLGLPKLQKIIDILTEQNSSYIPAFRRLIVDVEKAKKEANDNYKYLNPLKPFFEEMKAECPKSVPFTNLRESFSRIFHLIFLVWERSTFYNTPHRLVVLIREICNDLINSARNFVEAREILNIDPDDAIDKLETSLSICGLFKKYYFSYKSKVAKELPGNPWRIPLGALFYRLDQFLERCRDILELIQLVVMFNRLKTIEIGGTKGKILTQQIRDIYEDFSVAFQQFKSVDYDVLDVSNSNFDDDFYEFKMKNKELERKLGSILTKGFEDCNTVIDAFKLIESFHGMLDREIIQSDLEKKNEDIIRQYKLDLQQVQELFLRRRNNPPLYHNLPPTAGAMIWCRGILKRVYDPMKMIKSLKHMRHLLDSTEGKEVVSLYSSIMDESKKFEEDQFSSLVEVIPNIGEKLTKFLLRKDGNLLVVNFDPLLIRLLKEVKYFKKMNQNSYSFSKNREMPEDAEVLFEKVEVFRKRTSSLEMIVSMFNKIHSGLLEVERPLLKQQLIEIDEALEPGLTTLNWNSPDIENYIDNSMKKVKEAFTIMETLKLNAEYIVSKLKKWTKTPIFERKETRTISVDEFNSRFEEQKGNREKSIKEDGQKIFTKIEESYKALKDVEKDSEIWKNYVKYLNEIVVEGIVKSVVVCLNNLRDQLKLEKYKQDVNPMIEIKLIVIDGKKAMFQPSLDEDGELDKIMKGWVEEFFSLGRLMRIDGEEGDYCEEVRNTEEVQTHLDEIKSLFEESCKKCFDYRKAFLKHSYLWETDRQNYFKDFLKKVEKEHSLLKEFEAQITKYELLIEEMQKLPGSGVVGWIKIDSSPIKKSLVKLCEIWNLLFTNYLKNKVRNTLDDVYSFMGRVEGGISQQVVQGDVDGLKKVIRYIREVKVRVERGRSEGGIFKPLEQIKILLKKHETPLKEDTVTNLENGPERWNRIYERSLNKREKLSPLQDKEASKLKEQLVLFDDRIRDFRHEFLSSECFFWKSGIQKAYNSLDEWNVLINNIDKECKKNQKLQVLFELTLEEYTVIKDSKQDLKSLKRVWDMSSHVTSLFRSWMKTPFADVEVENLISETKKLRKKTQAQVFARSRRTDCFAGLSDEIGNMLTALPLVSDLRSNSMRKRHWKELLTECNKPGNINPNDPKFSLKQLIDLGLHEYEEQVRTIVNKAEKEKQIEDNLIKIEAAWEGFAFEYFVNDENGSHMLGDTTDIMEELEDNQVKLQNMISVTFVEFFIDKVTHWQTLLGIIESNVILWKEVQTKWDNLYPIFILSEDIKSQLAEDADRFSEVDRVWRKMMECAHSELNVLSVCTSDVIQKKMGSPTDFNAILTEMDEKLEMCEKALTDYLEKKRRIFPRFYFVSPHDLVDILSKGSFPRQVMMHMSKLVDAVETLIFEKDLTSKVAIGLVSKRGEEIMFKEPFNCEGPVEDWLNGILETIQETLHFELGEAHGSYLEQSKEAWLYNHPSQIVIVSSRIWFTSDVYDAFDRIEEGSKTAMKEYRDSMVDSITKLTAEVRKDITDFVRKKIITLITVDVHNRDVVNQLIEEKAENNMVFTWQSQLRYSWDDMTGCTIQIADAEFKYNFEYIGNCGCLVITPLTDRCYITLTQSLKLILGGAPAGPAGTGKTETTKDLGRALGVAVYVFNCSEQMTFTSLGNIFKGLSMTGCWGCFDEFNRVKIGVLSVVSTQFKSILDALKAEKTIFEFQAEMISLKKTVGVFVTMNPGYAGRTELPENLKALFRPCAMIVPDYEKICEIMLAAEGFVEAKRLSTKFVTLYRLNDELLSKQDHYDWGLRAIKSVLVIAGGLKRAEPHIKEELILLRALRDSNLAKLSVDDKKIFLDLIGDLFPRQEIDSKKNVDLKGGLKLAAKNARLQTTSPEGEMFLTKCLQFKELLDVRHSVFILGPAGSGKSEVWKNLKAGNELLKENPVKTWEKVMNPKAVSSSELYGFIHKQTKDWKDGLLSIIMREMSRSNVKKNKWIVLDGDIDTEWIESMNTVMDDNKVLTLASNERIPLKPDMRMIFEIDHLKHASPATVSRAGILFLNSTDINWMPFKESWLEKREDSTERTNLERLFDKYCNKIFDFIRKNKSEYIVPLRDLAVIESLCNLLGCLLTEENQPAGSSLSIYEYYFNFACVWAFGGAFPPGDDRHLFNLWIKKTFNSVKYPEAGMVYDYFVKTEVDEDGTIRAVFKEWEEIVKPYVQRDDILFKDIVVGTSQTTRLEYLMHLFIKKQLPIMLVGTAGTGKTSVIKEMLRQADEDVFMSSIVNFNSNTDSKSLQAILEQSLHKKPGNRYIPHPVKKLVYFLDDLNMPSPDKYGTQSAIALLRQHYEYEYWFDRNKKTVKNIQNTQYVAAMNPKAGSFTVTDRFQRHFMILNCGFPEKKDLLTIYQQILDSHFEPFHPDIKALSTGIVEATITLHQRMVSEFLPTAVKFYYKFNLRELSNTFQGMCQAQPDKIKNVKSMLKLWVHEIQRVFSDRLFEEDLEPFNILLKNISKKHFDVDKYEEELFHSRLMFNPFMENPTDPNSRFCYTEATDMSKMKKFLYARLDEHNLDNVQMNLELFDQAVEHICRIARIVANPRGNALLVGVGGSGKQSLSRLASFICGYEVQQIIVTSNYNIVEFQEDLKAYHRKCGKNIEMSLILTDTQIVDERMLVFVNDFLSSGVIPNLFITEEEDEIITGIQHEVRAMGLDSNKREICLEVFMDRVRSNLHIIFCCSPVGPHFRNWCRKFPAIVNCTAIDWFHPWPHEALVSVAKKFLEDVELEGEEMTDQVAKHMAFVHSSVEEASRQYKMIERRYNYTTPKSFLKLIEMFKLTLSQQREELDENKSRYEKGLDTIRMAGEKVSHLKVELEKERKLVEEKRKITEDLIKKMKVEQKAVSKEADLAKIQSKECAILAKEAEALEEEARKELEVAIPIVEAAKKALETLNKKDIQELKSFTKPKKEVARVTEAVFILTEVQGKVPKRISWNDGKKMMANPNHFMERLMTYDKEGIPKEKIYALEKYVNDPLFDPATIKNMSFAASGLCSWVHNIVKFWRIHKKVEPLRKKKKEATEKLASAKGKLSKAQSRVRNLQKRVDDLQRDYNKAAKDLQDIQDRAQKTEDKINLAKRLTTGLKDENTRWSANIEEIKIREKTLVGDCLLASSFISYLGAFTMKYREELLNEKWLDDIRNRNIPMTENIDPVYDVLTNEATVAQWNNEGLPSDRHSTENGAIVGNCERWPLFVDPQLQASKWIKSKEDKNLRIVQLTQEKYLKVIEDCVREGYPVMIENIGEEIDSVLTPILCQDKIKKGRREYIQIGEKEVEYNKDFRLYLQTKLSNPHYRPEILAQTTLLNFMVTQEGLEDQLLAVVVNREKPELEKQRVMLLRKERECKIRLAKCEDDLLFQLTNNRESDILENRSLIENLEFIKKTAVQVKKAVEEIKVTSEKINKSRDVYSPVSARGASLYFLINQLNTIDHMYQYSLESFLVIFLKALEKAKQSEKVEERVQNIIEAITYTCFNYVSRGLFERHKLIFSTMLCFSVSMKELKKEEFEFLIKGTKKVGSEVPDVVSKWCSEESWFTVQALAELKGGNPPFSSLPEDMMGSWRRWKEWCEFEKPETKPLPLEWKSLGPFQKLLIIRCLRPDRLTMSVRTYIMNRIGERYIHPQQVELSASFADTTPTTPIFFILSAGVDPISEVESMGHKKGYSEHNGNLISLSLGDGQEPVAEENLVLCAREGKWMMLANLHLVPEWLPHCEKMLDRFAQIWRKQQMKELEKKMIEEAKRKKQEKKKKTDDDDDDDDEEVVEEEEEEEDKKKEEEEGEGEKKKKKVEEEEEEETEGEGEEDDDDKKTTTTTTTEGEEEEGEKKGEGEEEKVEKEKSEEDGETTTDGKKTEEEDKKEEEEEEEGEKKAEEGRPCDDDDKKQTKEEEGEEVEEEGLKKEEEEEEEEEEGKEKEADVVVVAKKKKKAVVKKNPVADIESDDFEVNKDFRLFLTAEPSNSIPIGVLQRSIKLTNEPPNGLKANLHRALAQFDDSTWEGSSKQTEFKAILFSLCFYHSCIIERKKYGPQGWNKMYPFNLGDLTTCIAVLNNYLEDKPKIPWEDLRYVFGEIMYGGHITDDWDRILSNTYLKKFVVPELVDSIDLCPDFPSPPASLNYAGFLEYIDENLPAESPLCFGLHPNAEIGFLTDQGQELFMTILEMQPRESVVEAGVSVEEKMLEFIEDLNQILPETYDLEEIVDRLGDEDRSPYQNTFYQECEYMNMLLEEVVNSLSEVKLGIKGTLSITDKMQEIMDSIILNQVPKSWKKVSFTSLRNMTEWKEDLVLRNRQLSLWKEDLMMPKVVNLSLLYNPQSFLTAIMQATSRKTGWPLDKMTLHGDVTKRWNVSDIETPPRDGAYVTGMFLEGATFDISQNCLVESRLKELYSRIPIVHIRAVQDEKLDPKAYFNCPVYKTKLRGPHYVFNINMRTKMYPDVWIIRGVALLLDILGMVAMK